MPANKQLRGFEVSEGGLEHTSTGNFPNSGKFPWTEHSGRHQQVPVIRVPCRFPGRARAAAARCMPGPDAAPDAAPPVTRCAPAEPMQAKYPPICTADQSVPMAIRAAPERVVVDVIGHRGRHAPRLAEGGREPD